MYKRKIKFSAWLVLICMIMNLLSYVPISAKETLGISEEITQIQNELEVVPQQIDLSEEDLSEEEIAEIISNKTIHELTAYEYNQVIKHSNVNEEIFENVSALEYSLEDTIAVCKILQNVDMTTEQFAEAVTNFGDLETAISQGKKFANYRYTHSSIGITKDPICVGFFISGKYSGEILKARAMAFLIKLPVEQTNNFTEEITEYPDDDTLGYIANLFCTKRDILDEYITQKQITAEEFSEIVNENIGSVLEETGDAITTYGGGSEGYYDPATHPLAPFSFDVNGTETINEMTGAVDYQKTFATITGKNGLDLTIGARYNTANSCPGEITAVNVGIGTVSPKNKSIRGVMYSPLARFAAGWSLNLTYIHYYVVNFDDVYSSINLADGSVRSIKRRDVYNEDLEEITLDDGNIDIYDVRLFKDSSYTDNDVTSMFCIKYKDGKKEYIDAQGK